MEKESISLDMIIRYIDKRIQELTDGMIESAELAQENEYHLLDVAEKNQLLKELKKLKEKVVRAFQIEQMITDPRKEVTFRYRNWKGEVHVRHVIPKRVWYGETEYHPQEQYLLEAFDLDKSAYRDFAVDDILEIYTGEESG